MIKGKDKSDRATVEQVMDPRTRMIVFKMIQRGIINELNGCIRYFNHSIIISFQKSINILLYIKVLVKKQMFIIQQQTPPHLI